MIEISSSSESDYSETNTRIANLKINEADLLREAAEIEKALAAKKGEVQAIHRQIEFLTQQISPSMSTVKKATVHPKRKDTVNVGGDTARKSLLTVIENLLRESKDGLSLADLDRKIAESKSFSQSKKPRSMVDQAIFRLKKKERIVRDPENLRFFLNVG